jgi:parallel beta-helix repeat protein
MKNKRNTRTMIASIRPLAGLLLASLLMLSSASAATYTVSSTFDSGAGSFRQAIIDANANPGTDNINFSIPGAGPHIISLNSSLPVITGAVVINGYSEPGTYQATVNYKAKLLIVIDFNNLPGTGLFLSSTAGGSSISGLSIVNAAGGLSKAIYLNNASNCNIFGNYLGIYPDGSVGGNYVGIHIFGGDKNSIGNGSVANRNIISYNSTYGILIQNDATNKADSNLIQNNYIGTDAKGIADFGNLFTGILIQNSDYNRIYDNIISGNNANGIYLQGLSSSYVDSTQIQRNRIGINAGSDSLANLRHGILMEYASNTLIGGSSGNMNTIAFNGIGGVTIGLGSASVGNEISFNAIYRNSRLGIDLSDDGVTANDADDSDSGPNDLQNFPVIDSAKVTSGTTLTVWGKFLGINGKNYRLEFFNNPAFIGVDASGNGEGYASIHTMNVAGTGSAVPFTFTASNVSIYNDYITATATELSTKSTSEFSAVKIVNSVIDYVCDDTGPWTRTYQVSAVPQATSYTWSVPPGASITAGQNTTNVTVDWQGVSVGSYQVCVVANSTCGTSPSSCYPVVVQLCCVEPVVNAMTTTVCSGAAISVTLPTTPVTGTTITSYDISAVVNGGMGGTATTGNGITSTSAIFSDVFTNNSNTTQTVVYSVTPYSYTCSGPQFTITVTVNPVPTLVDPSDVTICSGQTTSISLTTAISGPTVTYSWSGALTSGTVTGFGSGSANPIAEQLVNTGIVNGVVTYTITPSIGSCSGTQQTVAVTVRPVDLITTCPETRAISGCNTSAITSPAYSATSAASSQAEFTSAPNNGVLNTVCGIASITYIDIASGSCPITVTRTWTVTDSYGNTETCQQTIEVDDNTAPSITCPSAITGIQCATDVPVPYANATAFTNAGGVITDNCGTATLSHVGDVTSNVTCANKFTITRTYQVTDACGNTATCEQVIIVNDNTAPTFTRPIDITVYKNANCLADTSVATTGDVVNEADNCSTGLNATHSDVITAGSCAGEYTIARTWSLVDACGNAAATQVQTITVEDNTAPTFTRPIDITVYKNANCLADTSVATTGDVVNEADNCSTGLNATHSDVITAGSCAGEYTIARTWSLVDACGNAAATQVQTITVEDNTAPTFTRPIDITVYKNANCLADTSVATTGDVVNEADNCSTGLNATHSDVITAGSCAGEYTIARTWSLVDACGNAAATQVQTITVEDNTAPTFTRPIDITVYKNANCLADTSVATTGDVVNEADNCSTGLNATHSDVITAGSCAGEYTIARTWSLVDACGNAAATQVQTITVEDNTAPTFTRPIDITVYKNANCLADTSVATTGDVVNEADNCSTGLNATHSDVITAGSCAGEYTIARTWSLVDACGNAAATQVQTITVEDNTAPTFTRPIDITVYKNANCLADTSVATTGDVVNEADNCSTGLNATHSDVITAGSCAGEYTIARTWSLVDACGNAAATQVQTITVEDNTAPTFTRPIDITVYKNANCLADTSVATTGDVVNEADNCSTGLNATHSDVITAGSCAGEYTIARTWSLVDACGNAAATQVQTITVEDNTAPTFTRPIDITVYKNANCLADTSVATTGDVVNEADNCSTGLNATHSDVITAGSCAGEYTIARTWSLVDACGNAAATQVQTITVEDNTAPTFTRPIDITVYKNANCLADTSVATTGDVVNEADNCSTGLNATHSDVITAGSCAGEYTIARTWSLVDACGNAAATQVQTITVEDNTAPTFTRPIDITVYKNANCLADTSVATTGDVVNEADNCSTGLNATHSDVITAGSCAGEYTIARTWSLVDACGNAAATQVQTITVEDNTAPTFTRPIDITVYKNANCLADTSVATTGDVVNEADNCSTGLNATHSDVITAGSCAGEYTIARTWSLVDACGNAAATQVQTITVEDNTAPTFTRPIDITVYKNANCLADTSVATTGDVVNEADNCSTGLNATHSDVITAGSCAGEYTIARTWSLVDACGNAAATQVQTITVEDNTAPTFTRPIDITVYKNANCLADTSVATTGDVVNEADNCSTGLNATHSDVITAGSCAGEYTIARTWSLVDACGNAAATQVQTITVEDNTAPTFTRPIDITVYKNANCLADTSVATTGDVVNEADNCSTGLNATHSDVITAGSCAGEYTIARTWSLVDACGNAAATQVQTITVEDNTAPTFTRPIDITVYKNANCLADTSVATTGDVVNEADNCSTGLNATHSDVITAGSCAGEYTIARTWSLVDACGNAAATQVQTITVEDNTAPTFTRPIDITVYKNANCLADTSVATTGDVVNEADNCSTGLNATHSDVITAGSCAGEYTIARTWSLVDACGNAAATQVQTITVEDNTAPTFTRPIDITVYKNANCLADTSVATTGDVVNEADNCSTGLNATHSDVITAGSCAGEYTIARTWSLVDDCGNAAATQVQTITVRDNTPPTVITQPLTIYLNASGTVSIAENAVNNGSSDNCSSSLTYDTDVTDFDCSDQGANTVVLTVTDDCGNTATATAIVTVVDNTLPTITCPANIVRSTDPGLCLASVNVPNPVIADNCAPTLLTWVMSGATTGVSLPTGINNIGTRNFNKGVTTIVYTVKDFAGNSASCSFTVTINDTEAPIAICKNLNINLGPIGTASITASQINNGSSDNCGITGIAVTPNSFNCTNVGPNTVTLMVFDAAGNMSTCSATVTVSDVTPPTANCQNITVALDNSGHAVITPTQVNNGSSDNCSVASLSLSKTNFTCADIGNNNVVLTVTDASGNTSTCQSTVTITNPNPPQVSVNDVTVWENAGTANFTISINKPWPCDVTVQYSTSNITANSGLDYTGVAPVIITIPAGSTTYPVSIPILEDVIVEISETYHVNITAATGAVIADAQGLGTILDNDVTTLSIGNATETEGNVLYFDAALSNPSSQPVTFNPVLSNGSANVGLDLTGPFEYSLDGGLNWITYLSGDISIPPMSLSVKFRVPSVDDIFDEGTEDFNLTLNVTSANTTNLSTTGLGTIIDNDIVISGTVFLDANELIDLTVNGVGTNAGSTVYMNLVDPVSNLVLASVAVDASGNYVFNSNVHPVLPMTNYRLSLSEGPTTIGALLPTATLDLDYGFTGENIGNGPGSDGVVDGNILVSTTTSGLVNVNFGIIAIPDLTPIITVVPSVMHGVTNYYVTVKVVEMNSVGTEGTIVVRIPFDSRWSFNGQYNPNLYNLGPFILNNGSWNYSQDTSGHIFTSSGAISGGSYTIFGFQVIWDAGPTRGLYTVTTQIEPGSGGERRITNNVDAEKIDYFIY